MELRSCTFQGTLWLLTFLSLLVPNFTFAAADCEDLVLSTPRLTLKPLPPADLNKIVDLITQPQMAWSLNIQKAKKKHVANALKMDSVDELEDAQRMTLGIYLGDEAIGYISARMEDHDWPKPREFKMNPIGRYQVWYSLAFAIDPQHWDKGLTGEAAKEFKSFIVSRLRPNGLHGQVDPRNENAKKLFTSLGFKEAVSRDGTSHFILVLR